MPASKHEWADVDLESIACCPACGSRELEHRYRCLIDLEEHVPGTWSMSCCKACRSLSLNPRPTVQALPKAYGSYYTHSAPEGENAVLGNAGRGGAIALAYLAHTFGVEGNRGRPSERFLVRLVWPLRQQLDYYMRHLPFARGRLLDVGCGSGGFLMRAVLAGWEAEGIEPDPIAAKMAREASNCRVHDRIDQAQGPFDYITLSHVIEHLHEPAAMLEECRALLRPGGAIWLATPNISGLGHRIYQESWQALETPRHLIMPSAKALERMLEVAGFRDVSFRRRGRGSSKRLSASAERARLLGRSPKLPRLFGTLVDLAASVSARAGEELVVMATRPHE